MTAVLEIENLSVDFGTLAAVRGISLTVNRGETHCLVGVGLWQVSLRLIGYGPAAAWRKAQRGAHHVP
jgi:peptide/nickel transport system ATP-binding protein